MALTKFGKVVREARQETGQTLLTMALALGTSTAFLSAIETGRSKVPMDYIEKIEGFFRQFNYPIEKLNLKQNAMVSNENVSLSGLSLQQQMMIAGFASSDLTKEQLEKFAELLRTINKNL